MNINRNLMRNLFEFHKRKVIYHYYNVNGANINCDNINNIQIRTGFYNKYKHGPLKALNPDPDYIRWVKDVFGPEGKEYAINEAKRVYKKISTLLDIDEPIVNDRTYIFEQFDSEKSIQAWRPVCDSDANVGYSTSNISLSRAGHALFHGVLDNRVPDDGVTQMTGAAGLIGPKCPRDKFVQVETAWDWEDYNTLEIKFRGDGRKYRIVLNTGTYTDDLRHYDNYNFPLYTKGGPYWQTYRIPFSKFIFTAKSAIQDVQEKLPTHHIKFVAILLEDSVDGPFSLEIDHIGLRYDSRPFNEVHAYELYKHDHIKFLLVDPECDPPER